MKGDTKVCAYAGCGKTFSSDEQNKRKYCSNKCRQADYRSYKRHYEPANTVETKRQQLKQRTCPECEHGFFVSGLQGARKYCSDACKQKAYRKRKEWRQKWAEMPSNDIKRPKHQIEDSETALRRSLEALAEIQASEDDTSTSRDA